MSARRPYRRTSRSAGESQGAVARVPFSPGPRSPRQLAHHRRVRIDAVPDILQADILVRRVLIVVVIRNREADEWLVKDGVELVERHAAAEHWRHDKRPVGRMARREIG